MSVDISWFEVHQTAKVTLPPLSRYDTMDGNILWPALSSTMITLPSLLNPTTEKVVPRSTPIAEVKMHV
jgi:hypothetical protein